MPRPQETDFPEYFARYIAKVSGNHIMEAIQNHSADLTDFYNRLPEQKAGYRYAPGKWTIKEVLQHVTDTERIFSYRVLRIARKDRTPLPSFDENSYAENSRANEKSLSSIKEEFLAVRKATDLLLSGLNDEQLSEQGISSNMPVTVNAICFIIYGHLMHHKLVLEEKYLLNSSVQ